MTLDLDKIDLGAFGISEEEQEKDLLNANLSEAVKIDPVKHSEVTKLSKQSGVPEFAVGPNTEQIKHKLKLDQIDIEGLATRSPKTSKFLTKDFNNSVIAQEDVINNVLESIEETFRGLKPSEVDKDRTAGQIAQDEAVALTGGLTTASQGVFGLLDLSLGFAVPQPVRKFMDDTLVEMLNATGVPVDDVKLFDQTITSALAESGVDFQKAQEAASNLRTPELKAQKKEVDTAFDDGFWKGIKSMTIDNPGVSVDMITESLPMMLGLVTAVRAKASHYAALTYERAIAQGLSKAQATKVSQMAVEKMTFELARYGAMLEGGQQAGVAAADYAADGDLKAKEAFGAIGSGITTSVVSRFSNYLGAKFGIDDVEASMAAIGLTGAKSKGVLGSVANIGGALVKEGPIEEGLQSLSEGMWDNYVKGRPLLEGADRNFAQGTVLGIGMAGPMSTVTELSKGYQGYKINRVIKSLNQEEQMNQTRSDIEQRNIDKLNADAVKSELRKNDIESFKQFIRDNDENDTHVFIDGSQVSLYLQEKTQEEIDNDAALKVLSKAVVETRETGVDAAIPVADFMGDIAGTDHFTQLRDAMTLSDSTMSPFRQEQYKADFEKYKSGLIAEAEKNASEYAEAQDIFESVRNQLIDSGVYSASVASVMAEIVPAWATAQAKRSGKTVQQVYADAGLTIEGPKTGEMSRLQREQLLIQAQESGYEGSDVAGAAEWNAAYKKFGKEGMTFEARMERAKAMGFDVDNVLYHGTSSDIKKGFGKGITYATSLNSLASDFAVYKGTWSGANVLPIMVKGNFLEVKADYGREYIREAELRFGKEVLGLTEKDYPNGMEIYDYAKDKGYDGVVFRGIIDDPGAPHISPNSDVYAVFDPKNIRSVNAAFDPDAADSSDLLAQSVSLRKKTETLKRFGLKPGGRYKTREVAAALEARQRSKYGVISKDDRSPAAARKIADWMVQEVLFELDNPDKSGVGWYSEKYQRSLDIFSEEFPELKKDKSARDTFTAIVAITSDGQKVMGNFEMAADIYRNYRETGKLTTTKGTQRQASVDNNLNILQGLLDEMTPEQVHEYLMVELSVKELAAIAKSNGIEFKSDYTVDTILPRAALVFGPKLGAFYANLMGAHGYLTMDRWWTRTFNRYRGEILKKVSGLADDPVDSKGRKKGLALFKESLGEPDISDDEALSRTIEYRKSFEAKGFKNGTKLEKAANTIYKHAFDELQDAPYGARDRSFMLDAVNKAAKTLKRKGYDITIADIQAILWYYEKRLYGEMGTTPTADISYEEAARKIVSNKPGGQDIQGGLESSVPVGEEIYSESEGQETGVAFTQPQERNQTQTVELMILDKNKFNELVQAEQQEQFNQPGEELPDLPDRIDIFKHMQGFDDKSPEGLMSIAAKAIPFSDNLYSPYDKNRPSVVTQKVIKNIEQDGVPILVHSGTPDKTAVVWTTDGQAYRVIGETVKKLSNDIDPNSDMTDNQGLTINILSREFRNVRAQDPATQEKERVESLRRQEIRRRQDRLQNIPEASPDFNQALQDLADWAENFEEFETALSPNMFDISDRNLTRLGRATMALEPDFYENAGSGEVTIYRAMPEGEEIEAGDWVSFNEEYAAGHESNVDDGRAQTISMEVDGTDVWWYGADENEHVYIPEGTWGNAESLKEVWDGLTGGTKPDAYPEVEGQKVYQFAGVGAMTAPVVKLAKAKEMLASDRSMASILRETGWFKDVDGKWKFEISDDQAEWKDYGNKKGTLYLDDVLKHDKLYEAYPGIKDTRVKFTDDEGGLYNIRTNTIEVGRRDKDEMMSTLLHEVQHAIQEREDFGRGGNAEYEFTSSVKRALTALDEQASKKIHNWKFENSESISEAKRKAEVARYGLMFDSMNKLIEYANHDKPSSVFRHIRNKLQWVYDADFKDNKKAQELQRMFYDVPGRHKSKERNAFLSNMAFEASQVLRDQIPPELLKKFKSDTRTTKGMLNALSREASKAKGQLGELQNLTREKQSAEHLKKRTEYKNPYEVYRALSGEIEARNTQSRASMDDEARRTTPPWMTADVRSDEAIILLGGMEIHSPEIMMSETKGGDNIIRGYFDPVNTVIRLNEASNMSTFLHEFAHFMYEMEIQGDTEMNQSISNWFKRNAEDVAKEANGYLGEGYNPLKQDGQPPVKTDITETDINQYLDVKTTGDKSKDSAIRRALHEQFARGFETYLMEGKAPSIELRNAFRTFARWLVQVYKAMRGNLNVSLDDQMRQVFDRLLATEEQIAAAEARARIEPLFTDAAMAGMTEEEYISYQKRQEKVKDIQSETLRDKMIKALTQKAEQWWKEEKADLIDEEIERLSKEKIYTTITQLKDGDIKLDHATVKEMVGEEKVNKLGHKSIRIPVKLNSMTAKGQQGIHPDEAAAFLGYGSGAELLNELINAPDIKVVAEANAEAQMIERHGDIFTDGTIQQQADEAIQNEERGKLILQELKILSRGTNQLVIDRQTMKDLAQDKIGKLSFREIHPGKYRKAEIRAAQEAARMLAEGNMEGAAQAKSTQAMNYYLGMTATEAKNNTVKIVDRMSRYNKKKVREEIQKAENGYWEQIVKILERFEFRKSATLASVDKVNQDINTWAKERMDVDGDGLVLHNAVLNESYITHWKNVAYSDLQGINDSVKNIEHVARYANKLTRLGEEIEYNKLVEKLVNVAASTGTGDFKVKASVADDMSKVEKNARWLMAQMTKIPFMMSWMDGMDRVGIWFTTFSQPMTDAYNAELELYGEVGIPIAELINNRSKEDLKRHNTTFFIPEIKGTANGTHTGNLKGHEIIAIALNVGNQSNLKKLLLGEQWANPENDAEITLQNPKLQAVLKHMTKSDWEMVQKIWDQINILYPKLAEVHRKTTGLVPSKVEATPVETPFGTFKGGYYPVKGDPARDNKAAEFEERSNAEVSSMFSNNASIQSSVNASATNERTGHYAPMHLTLNVVLNHVQETIHYITHHDAVREVNKLLRDPRIKKAVTEKLGPEEFAQLKPWLNDIAKDGRNAPTKSFVDAAFNKLRLGTTLGVMGFKASTGIIQVSGLSNTVAEVGTAPVYQSMRTILGSKESMQSAWEFAVENSKVLKHRTQTMDREIKNALQQIEGKRGVLPVVQEASMKHIALIQTYMVDLPSWHAAYIKELSESGNETKAFQYADWVVENIQGSGATKDMAALMRNQTKTHTIFTMFMTFFSSFWNAQRDLVRGASSGKYSTSTVAAKAMFYFAIPVLFEMMMRGEFGGEDDDESNLQKYLTNVALYPVQSIPFFRDVANGLIGGYNYNSSPVTSMIEQGLQGLKGSTKAAFDEDKEVTKGQIKSTSKLAGAALGIPGTAQAWATGEHLYDVIVEGEELTMHQLLFGPKRD